MWKVTVKQNTSYELFTEYHFSCASCSGRENLISFKSRKKQLLQQKGDSRCSKRILILFTVHEQKRLK